MPALFAFTGKAQSGINKKTNEFRLKLNHWIKKEFLVKTKEPPENWLQDKILVRTFPFTDVTKPSEEHSSKKRTHKTKERTTRVYPELKQEDKVVVTGFMDKGTPLISVVMKNFSTGITSTFVDEQITLEGMFSTFNIKNPLLNESEKLLNSLQSKFEYFFK
jgi:hypothetical protein